MLFKQFLKESTGPSSLDITKFDIDDVLECYRNTGYVVSSRDRRLYNECKFIDVLTDQRGGSGAEYVFVMLVEDEEDPERGMVIKFFVSLGKQGKLIAETAAHPLFEGTYEEAEEAFAKQDY
jgi:hypothetical protein